MKIFISALIICAQVNANPIVIRNHEPRVNPIVSGTMAFFTTTAAAFHKMWIQNDLPLLLEKLPEKLFRMFGNGEDEQPKRLPNTVPTPRMSETESDSDSTNGQDSQEEIQLEDGSTYVGETRNGQPWGDGTATYSNGARYVGSWFDGVKHGRGQYFFEEGRLIVYQDEEWSDGSFERVTYRELREGVIEIAGGLYQGPVNADGQPHTYDSEPGTEGIIEYVDGRSYQGELDRGQPSGNGSMRYSNGDLYKGSFCFGLRNGEGILFMQDQTTIEGEWIDDEHNNVGNEHRVNYANGWTYNGPLDELRRPHGSGILEHTSGEKYKGGFVDGQKHGLGTIRLVDGTEIQSQWRNGVQMAGFGETRLDSAGDEIYRGHFLGDHPHGAGAVINRLAGTRLQVTAEDGELADELLLEEPRSPVQRSSPDSSAIWSEGFFWGNPDSRSNSPSTSEW